MKFSKYSFSEQIKENLDKLNFKKPTDIQYKSIPSIMKGEDVLAIAQTGTGKTAAFAIPIIDMIHNYKKSNRSYGISCLVMVPTRELAIQIGEVFNTIASHTKVKPFALTGGVDQKAQIDRLRNGVDILIATPGRMFDLINQKEISLDSIQTVVLDEADHMLALGFIEDIKYVKKLIHTRHQTLFFSATINPEIKKLAFSQIKGTAIRIQISPKNPVSKNVYHRVMFIEMDDKRFFLEKFIKEHPNDKVIIFVRTKVRAERVKNAMKRVGIETETLHSDREQNERLEIMGKFRGGEISILIATDVSARGIDIPDIKFVINYDLPENSENYVHRVGRTGRGFNKGIALSFCSSGEKELLDAIEEYINSPIENVSITKKGYKMALDPEEGKFDWHALMKEEELLLSKKRKSLDEKRHNKKDTKKKKSKKGNSKKGTSKKSGSKKSKGKSKK